MLPQKQERATKSSKRQRTANGHWLSHAMSKWKPGLREAKDDWNTSIIATQAGNTAQLPAKHSMFKSRCKKYCRGFSETLHNGDLTVTYWNDNNDLKSGRENWSFIETEDRRNRIKIYAPKAAQLYRSMYGWVDRSNQALSYCSTECRTRKHNRVLDSITEMYALNNTHAIWINSSIYQEVVTIVH